VAETGDRIGPYEVVRLIARGGSATVYEAYQPALGRSVTLKEFDPRGGDPIQARRFIDETRAAAALDHPNIVAVFDHFEVEDVEYMATEYLPRGSLRSWVGRLTTAQVFGVVESILAALAYAHEHGVVHGDLKPENVLITHNGSIKIADFAIAKAYFNAAATLSSTGMAVGTPAYMAPEQAMAQAVGPYTDLYAVGVMTYEMLSGRLPFEGESPVSVMHKQVSVQPPALTGVDPRLAAWVARLLEKAPEARLPGAHQAWRELEPTVVDLLGPLWREDATLGEASPRSPQSPEPEVVAPRPAADPAELEGILRRAARTGIVAAEQPTRHRQPPPRAPEPEPAPVAAAPAQAPDPPREPPPEAALGRRLIGWRAVPALIFAALAGGIGYLILERIFGSTVRPLDAPSEPPDDVTCTVFAPPIVAPDESFLVQAFVHVPEHAEDVRALALEMDTTAARRVFRTLAAPIPRGSRLHFELHAPGLQIDDPVASLVWRGRPEAVQFGVSVPPGTSGTVIATLYMSLDFAPLGHVKFKLAIEAPASVVAARVAPEPQGEDARRYRAAFISYASKDRDKVLERVQMLPLVGIRYFQDVLNLEPGDRWQRRLELGIDECDLFLLFWSGEAKESKWVRQEVDHALKRRSGDELAEPEIKPVIIEGPPVIAPWAELAHLHFDERVLYFMSR
jgi:tRNA A-37 threonylcarbamoyl transferase component Bud32